MSHDADWVQDVKRWYFATNPATASGAAPDVENTDFALGYETAHPALVPAHWTDQPATGADRSAY